MVRHVRYCFDAERYGYTYSSRRRHAGDIMVAWAFSFHKKMGPRRYVAPPLCATFSCRYSSSARRGVMAYRLSSPPTNKKNRANILFSRSSRRWNFVAHYWKNRCATHWKRPKEKSERKKTSTATPKMSVNVPDFGDGVQATKTPGTIFFAHPFAIQQKKHTALAPGELPLGSFGRS